jgi:hypothetical protein
VNLLGVKEKVGKWSQIIPIRPGVRRCPQNGDKELINFDRPNFFLLGTHPIHVTFRENLKKHGPPEKKKNRSTNSGERLPTLRLPTKPLFLPDVTVRGICQLLAKPNMNANTLVIRMAMVIERKDERAGHSVFFPLVDRFRPLGPKSPDIYPEHLWDRGFYCFAAFKVENLTGCAYH